MPFMWALWLCRSAQTSAAVLLAGTAALRLLAWGTAVERFSGWNRLAGTSWGILLVAAVVQLGLTAADMSGLPLPQACSAQVLGPVLAGTTFGAVWKVRLGLLAGVLLIGQRPGAAPREAGRTRVGVRELVGVVLSAAILTTLIWSGHARASDRRAWLLPSDVLHVLAAGAWVGGLAPLGWLLAHARHDAGLIPDAVAITRRFSRLSGIAVAVLAASGIVNSGGLVGTFSALGTSPYGQLVLAKAALFTGMIGLGAVNRRTILAAGSADPAGVVRRLLRNVALESALALGVLLATEALAMNAPPAEM